LAGASLFGLLLAFLVPSAMGRIVLIIPILQDLSERLGLPREGKDARGILLAGILGTALPSTAILPSNIPNNVLAGIYERLSHQPISYSDYLLLHFPVLGAIKTVLLIVTLAFLYRSPSRWRTVGCAMASIRSTNGRLFWDFRYRGHRCREYTVLDDTPENRRKMAKVLKRIEEEIEAGTFDYRRTFPNSKLAEKFDASPKPVLVPVSLADSGTPKAAGPVFKDFAETWFDEMSVGWRRTYVATVRQILDKHLLPQFGEQAVGSVRRENILSFRSELAKVRGRKEGLSLSPRRINAITLVLCQVFNEAADRFDFSTPVQRIKPLKIRRADVRPFALDEVQKILDTVRPDFRNYYIVRFFTGMRTGEIDGLKWKYVDLERRLILVRESHVAGEQEEDTKTPQSQRDIQISIPVAKALEAQIKATGEVSEYVFCNRDGQPLDTNNVTKRVWYPLLRHLKLDLRNPYQTRHTAATLWLAAGESPEWIAKQMGHATTEMLFRVYSRYVPNLTRQDGSAFERLLLQSGAAGRTATTTPNRAPTTPDEEGASDHV
jgi:integrase